MLFDETSYQRRHQTEEHIFLVCAFCYFFLQKSIWHRSGPWVLKFSVHPNMMISRTLCSMLCAFSSFHPLFWTLLLGRYVSQKFNNSSFFCIILQILLATSENSCSTCGQFWNNLFLQSFLHSIRFWCTGYR